MATVTNQSGSVVERWSYNAYGVPTIKNSANATIAKSAVGNDRGFTGYKLDFETGLYAARARKYSAKLGRFVNRDPIRRNVFYYSDFKFFIPLPKDGYVSGLNLYAAYFAPRFIDPSGMVCPGDTPEPPKPPSPEPPTPPKNPDNRKYDPSDPNKPLPDMPGFNGFPGWVPEVPIPGFPDGYWTGDHTGGGPAWGDDSGWVGVGAGGDGVGVGGGISW